MKVISVEIQGTSPLLQHKFTPQVDDKAGPKVYDAEKEAEKATYRGPDGYIYCPSDWVLMAMNQAAADFKYKNRKTYKGLLLSIIAVDPDRIPLLDSDGEPRETWDEIDARPAVVQRSRVMRWRPRFNEWKLRFNLIILNEAKISPATLKAILDVAGQEKGLGDYRPRFGRFMVTRFEEIREHEQRVA